ASAEMFGAEPTRGAHAPGLWVYLLVGIAFGIVLTKSEVISWFRIQEMFRFQGFHMFGVFATALPTATIATQLLKRRWRRTLGGDSTIWRARALKPGGRRITLEIGLHHADVARRNLARAGLSDRVEVRVGRAADLLEAMQGFVEPFDFIFIDADKASSDIYLKAVLTLSHPGTVIIVD